jgi:multidrug efflux pump subunit AcrA (membrane-fusion protein)
MSLKLPPRSSFTVVWVCAATLAGLLYWRFGAARGDFVGIVESRTHSVSAQEPGRIASILAAVGEEVRAGQVLATLDTSDLTVERALLAEEADRLENVMSADRRRYTLEYQNLRLQRDANAADVGLGRAEVEAKRGELEAIQAEVERLEDAERVGLGRPRDLSALLAKRDAAARFVREGAATLSAAAAAERAGIGSDGVEGEADSVVLSMLNGRFERRKEIKLALARLDERVAHRRVMSPCNCRVASLNYLIGDTVDAFAVIMKVEELQPEYVDVYVPEASGSVPEVGQGVRAYPRRPNDHVARGVVTSVAPGFSVLPERLWLCRTETWARHFRVKLDSGHGLIPGELTEVELVGRSALMSEAHAEAAVRGSAQGAVPKAGSATAAVPHETLMRERSTLLEIEEPEARRGNMVEPSGLARLPDVEPYLTVSDETGRSGMTLHHGSSCWPPKGQSETGGSCPPVLAP